MPQYDIPVLYTVSLCSGSRARYSLKRNYHPKQHPVSQTCDHLSKHIGALSRNSWVHFQTMTLSRCIV